MAWVWMRSSSCEPCRGCVLPRPAVDPSSSCRVDDGSSPAGCPSSPGPEAAACRGCVEANSSSERVRIVCVAGRLHPPSREAAWSRLHLPSRGGSPASPRSRGGSPPAMSPATAQRPLPAGGTAWRRTPPRTGSGWSGSRRTHPRRFPTWSRHPRPLPAPIELRRTPRRGSSRRLASPWHPARGSPHLLPG